MGGQCGRDVAAVRQLALAEDRLHQVGLVRRLHDRTGKRTTVGALQDGVNSVIRYVNNNFYDGYFEDCLNLTFDRVRIDAEADKLVLKRKKFTFVASGGADDLQDSFFAVVLLPTAAACFLASRLVGEGGDEERVPCRIRVGDHGRAAAGLLLRCLLRLREEGTRLRPHLRQSRSRAFVCSA